MGAQGLFSIGGISSGLDTDNIVRQLMQLERQPAVRIERQQDELETQRAAWSEIATRLSTLRAATDKLRRPSGFTELSTAESTDSNTARVTANGNTTQPQQLTFTVDALATRQQTASIDGPDGYFAGLDDSLHGRELTIETADGAIHDLTAELGSTATLADLIDSVNGADISVRAQAIEVEPGRFRLSLEAERTGTSNAFAVNEPWLATTQPASDAQLSVGGVTVTRPHNAINDLLPGATIELAGVSDRPVTVSVGPDIDRAVNRVKAFAESANSALTTVAELTRFDAATGETGPLQGQSAANRLAFNIRDALTRPIAGLAGTNSQISTAGITVDRDGFIQVDVSELRSAFESDFAGTASRFVRAGAATDPSVATNVLGQQRTEPGAYALEISREAQVAQRVGASFSPLGEHQPKTFRVRSPDGTAVAVTIDTSDTTTLQVSNKIQAALQDAGVTNLTAGLVVNSDGSESLTLETSSVGSGTSFEVWAVDEQGQPIPEDDVFGLAGVHTGTDVEGTIAGTPATGNGRILLAEEGPAAGLRVETAPDLVVAESVPAMTSVNFSQGIGGVFDQELARFEGASGILARQQRSLDAQAAFNQERINNIEQRLETREVTLRRQFTAMEQALDRLNSQSDWLDSQLAQLSAINSQRR